MKLVDFAKLLPADLQPGERVLWYGRPDWFGLARRAFRGDLIAVYFAVMAAWNIGSISVDAGSTDAALAGAKTLASGGLALALLGGLAFAASRTTLYVVTTQRVVMKIGIALPVFFNLPYAEIASASLHGFRDGTGDIPLTLPAGNRIAYLQLWPHARPFHFKHPQPMLRAVPDSEKVAEFLGRALIAAANARGEAAAAPIHDGKAQPSQAPSYSQDAIAAA